MKYERTVRKPLRAALMVAALLWAGLAAAENRFYLTIERSFSAEEHPQIRLDFLSAQDPVALKVLRPKDLAAFLEGQLNLSRSYEEPLAEINSGHYFVRGVNFVRSPLPMIQKALSADFRTQFKGGDFDRSLLSESWAARLASAPKEIRTGPPAGFDIVREMYIDLQRGGEVTPGLYDWYPSDDYRFKTRDIELDPLSDGVYLLQAIQGRYEAQALLQVSSLSVQVKQSDRDLVVRVVDRQGQGVAGAETSYRDGRGKWIAISGTTDEAGQLFFRNQSDRLDGRLVIQVNDRSGRRAIVDTDFLPAQADNHEVFVLTDRPIFKPGEQFFFKGIAREFAGGRLIAPETKEGEAQSRLVRSDGTDSGLQSKVRVTGRGSFFGSFQLEPYTAPGLYQVSTNLEGKDYSGELRVRDYVKPTYYLELLSRDETIRPGAVFNFAFKARRFAGGIPQGVRYEVFVYRKKFESPVWLEEAGGVLQAGHDYWGEVRSTQSLAQPQRIYSSVEKRSAEEGSNGGGWNTAPELTESADANVSIEIPAQVEGDIGQDWIYTVMVRSQDAQGAAAILTENVYVTQSDAVPSMRFKKQLFDGREEEIELAVVTQSPDDKPAGNVQGAVKIEYESPAGETRSLPEILYTTDPSGLAVLKFPRPEKTGRLKAMAVARAKDGVNFRRAAESRAVSAILGGENSAAVLSNRELELYPGSTILPPGGKGKYLALLPASANGQQTRVWETVAGSRIFDVRSSEIPGRSAWFEVEAKPEYGTGFYHTLTVAGRSGKYREQTLGFRVLPLDKMLSIEISPEKESAEPLKPFQLFFQGARLGGQACGTSRTRRFGRRPGGIQRAGGFSAQGRGLLLSAHPAQSREFLLGRASGIRLCGSNS